MVPKRRMSLRQCSGGWCGRKTEEAPAPIRHEPQCSHNHQQRIAITFERSPKQYYGCTPWISIAHHNPKTAGPRGAKQ